MNAYDSRSFTAAVCSECDRLSRDLRDEVAQYAAFMVSAHDRPFASQEEVIEVRKRFKDARTRVEHCRLLLKLHRWHAECDRELIPRIAPFIRTLHSPDFDLQPGKAKSDRAAERRKAEFQELSNEGVPVKFHSRWHVSIGELHVWTYTGRYSSALTGRIAKLGSMSMRNLVIREFIETDTSCESVARVSKAGGNRSSCFVPCRPKAAKK